MSRSEKLRQEGNKFYKKGITIGLSPVLTNSRLAEALKLYFQAKSCAVTLDELSSVLKNIGMTNYRIASFKSKEYKQQSIKKLSKNCAVKVEDEIKFYCKESLNSLFSAMKTGENCKNREWIGKLHSEIVNIFSEIVQFVSFDDFNKRIGAMFVMCENIIWNELKVMLYLHIAGILHQRSVTAIESYDFRDSLHCIHEMNFPLEEADRLTSSEEMKMDVNIMRTDANYQLASTESMQACTIAEQQLSDLLLNEECLNMNMVYDTLDLFKDGELKAREINLEQEAISCYYQGYIYEKIFKLRMKGKTFYMRVMELTEAAKPKLFTKEKWYIDCVASLKVFQDEAAQRDDTAQEEKRQKFREELEKELNELNAAKITGGATETLKHIYSKHPPKNKPVHFKVKDIDMWDGMDTKKRKRLLLTAIKDYHPDKNRAEEHGEKWSFLASEISKTLTYFHDIEKAVN